MLAILDEQQVMLRDMLARLAPGMGVRNPSELGTVDGEVAWQQLASLGILALRTRDGGAPLGSGVECMLAAEALGAALSPLPLTGNLVAAELLNAADAPDAWLRELSAGEHRFGLLLEDRLVSISDGVRRGPVWEADGASSVLLVRDAGDDLLLLCASLDDAPGGGDTLASADLTRHLREGGPFDGRSDEVGIVAADAWQRCRALALTLVCADTVGVMRAALDGAVAYAGERVQYGRLIGSFQAVQHLCAEARTRLTGAVAATNYAAWCVDGAEPADALRAARVAKAYCAGAGREVTEVAMQVYGGIGQTFEHPAHLFTRRALFDGEVLGGAAHHLDHLADDLLPPAR